MGLCKCPKRKVTNQFCFEHRVNVCEHCMVASHAKCVVQSYLAWLQVKLVIKNMSWTSTSRSREMRRKKKERRVGERESSKLACTGL